MGLIFRSALPEELDWNTRAEDVALSLDALKRCLINTLVALDRDTPQTKQGLALPTNFPTQEPSICQEPPWLWFTLPELGFPLLMDQYRRPLHPEIEVYMRRYVSNGQEWEEVDDEDCWGINYTEPTAHVKAKIESILYTWGEKQPEVEQDEAAKQIPEEGAVRIFEKPEFWNSTIGLTQAMTTQGVATIQLPSGPLSMDRAQ